MGLIGSDGRAGVYWRGDDGAIYVQTNLGNVQKVSESGAGVFSGGDQTFGGLTYRELNGGSAAAPLDPNPPAVTGANGGGGGSTFQDTSAARAGTQSSIDSLDTIFNNKINQAQGEYDALIGQYGVEEGDNLTAYNKQKEGNEGNRESQQQAGLLAAANGSRGLYSTLASIGALGGTGKLLANRAVSNEANLDIGQANKTFDTNATNLFDSYGALKKQEAQRRLDAENTLTKTKQAHEYDINTTRQGLWKDMADLWTKAGNNAEANAALGKAQGLTTAIANASRPNIPEYARTPLNFQAPALDSYLAGANDMTVNTSAGSGLPINGAIYTSTKKRDKMI